MLTVHEGKVNLNDLKNALHPGKSPCGCCVQCTYKGKTFWITECDCGNNGDLSSAAAWVTQAYLYEKLIGESVE